MSRGKRKRRLIQRNPIPYATHSRIQKAALTTGPGPLPTDLHNFQNPSNPSSSPNPRVLFLTALPHHLSDRPPGTSPDPPCIIPLPPSLLKNKIHVRPSCIHIAECRFEIPDPTSGSRKFNPSPCHRELVLVRLPRDIYNGN